MLTGVVQHEQHAFDPFVPRPRITFKPGLIAEENLAGRILQELEGEGLAKVFPSFAIRRLGYGAGNLADIFMFMEVAHEHAVAELDLLFLAQPAAELDGRPMGFACQ